MGTRKIFTLIGIKLRDSVRPPHRRCGFQPHRRLRKSAPFKALNRRNIRLKTLNLILMGGPKIFTLIGIKLRDFVRPPHRRCGFQPHRRLRKPAPFKALNRRNIRLKTLNLILMGGPKIFTLIGIKLRDFVRPPHRRCGFQPHRRLRKPAPFKALNRRNIRLKTLNSILMGPKIFTLPVFHPSNLPYAKNANRADLTSAPRRRDRQNIDHRGVIIPPVNTGIVANPRRFVNHQTSLQQRAPYRTLKS